MSQKPPAWCESLLTQVRSARAEDFTRLRTPRTGGRPSAVLVLLGEQPEHGPDVLLLQRAATLRTHAGQPAFPGGATDPEDSGPVATALREAREEVGLDPDSVTVLAELPRLWIPVSDFVVTPVLGWWHQPHPVHPHQPAEVAHVARISIAELVDPDNRLQVRLSNGWIGPAFQVRGMLVWGFTAGVLTALLDMGGWTRPWPRNRVVDLPPPQTASIAGTDQPTEGADQVVGPLP